MATKLSIINLAFAHLAEPIVDELAGDPPPPNVAKALAQWDQALEVALTREPWLCALSRQTIPAVEDTGPPDWKYPYLFKLPGDALRVFTVMDGNSFAWEACTHVDSAGAETRAIRATFAGPLKVAFVARRSAKALTPLLADALACELASRLAGPIQSSESKAKYWGDKAVEAYAKAAGSEATEIGGEDPLFTFPLHEARAQAL